MIRTVALLLLVLAACVAPPPLYSGLGDGHRPITTSSAEAQAYFDQGLALCWGFNHDEAHRAFEQVARLDGDCAMAWWGMAYTLGPNINLPLTDDAVSMRAYRAARTAKAMAHAAAPVERALIDALTTRFADPPPEDRGELDLAYADAMREVWREFPDDPLVGVLFADALMNVSNKWREWPDGDDRGPHTPEIVATLEDVLARHPAHPGANHFYIHAVEASTRPERALVSSDRLQTAVPAAGHLVHMPAHIYVRVGDYEQAISTNREAVVADDAFFATAPDQGVYHFYRAHNHHFLIWAAMFQGSRGKALAFARDMVSKLPWDEMDEHPRTIEAFIFVPQHVMMRFGMWEEILAEPAPGEQYPLATALWHHARGVAYANTARLDRARAEAEAFERVAATVPPEERVHAAKPEVLLEIARNMMNGEILFKEGRHDEALQALRAAVAAEDTLPYSEPPGWMQPMRHALGALLLEAGRVEEAEQVYRTDLDHHPNNGWSLHGLAESLRRQGNTIEAAAVEEDFRAAWERADVEITSSCFCRTPG